MLLLWPCLLLMVTLDLVVAQNVNLRLLKANVEFLWWVGSLQDSLVSHVDK